MVDYKSYRPKSLTLEATEKETGISVRSIIRYDKHEQIPPELSVIKLARTYNAPAMLFEHHGFNTEIGRRFFCRPLNHIDRSLPSICFKTSEELNEMVHAIQTMCSMALNGRDLEKWGCLEEFDKEFQEVIDVEQLILETKIKYAEIRGLKALEKRYREHDAKCLAAGYHLEQKEKPALIAEGRATYKYA